MVKIGYKQTQEHILKRIKFGKDNPSFGKHINLGENNGNWKGDNIGKGSALHVWVRRNFPVPEVCDNCRQKQRLDLANITGVYSRDFSNWKYLCRKCHMLSDGRLKTLVLSNLGKESFRNYKEGMDY